MKMRTSISSGERLASTLREEAAHFHWPVIYVGQLRAELFSQASAHYEILATRSKKY